MRKDEEKVWQRAEKENKNENEIGQEGKRMENKNRQERKKPKLT